MATLCVILSPGVLRVWFMGSSASLSFSYLFTLSYVSSQNCKLHLPVYLTQCWKHGLHVYNNVCVWIWKNKSVVFLPSCFAPKILLHMISRLKSKWDHGVIFIIFYATLLDFPFLESIGTDVCCSEGNCLLFLIQKCVRPHQMGA